VHANKISSELIFAGFCSSIFCFWLKACDKSSAKIFKPLKPSLPVKAFAFLVFTNKALIFFFISF